MYVAFDGKWVNLTYFTVNLCVRYRSPYVSGLMSVGIIPNFMIFLTRHPYPLFRLYCIFLWCSMVQQQTRGRGVCVENVDVCVYVYIYIHL